jgi:hypothetical protein
LKKIVFIKGHYTQQNMCKNWVTQNLAFTNVDIYSYCLTVNKRSNTNLLVARSGAEVLALPLLQHNHQQ